MRTAILVGGQLDGTLISRDKPGVWPIYLDAEGQPIPARKGDLCAVWRRCPEAGVYCRQTAGAGATLQTFYLHSSMRGQEGAVSRRLEQEALDAYWLLQLGASA